jgi:hypothetical protein
MRMTYFGAIQHFKVGDKFIVNKDWRPTLSGNPKSIYASEVLTAKRFVRVNFSSDCLVDTEEKGCVNLCWLSPYITESRSI